MDVSILTPDSPRPNLAAMKISAWHKAQGDKVELNMGILPANFTYASLLFRDTPDPYADLIGGPKYPDSKLDPEIEAMKPDYDLFSIYNPQTNKRMKMDYSLGYTYRACPRTCDFCIVPKQDNPKTHYSIWEFHDKRFKKICLLNNNTLADPQCRETFEEIIAADLIVKDENGYDARLITEEYADYLSRIRFDGYLHIAWDFMEHEAEVLRGVDYLKAAGVKNIMCYVLIGNDTPKADYYRVMKLHNRGIDPFVMPMDKTDTYQKRFARWCNHKATFKTVAWKDYTG